MNQRSRLTVTHWVVAILCVIPTLIGLHVLAVALTQDRGWRFAVVMTLLVMVHIVLSVLEGYAERKLKEKDDGPRT